MSHYIDIHLRRDPDFPQQQLLNVLYTKLHRALVGLTSDSIGTSFPLHDNAQRRLGSHMRLHGPAAALERLTSTPWLAGMRDHVDLSPLRAVPADTQYRHVVRVQAKSSPDRLRRRAMRRHGIDAEEACRRIPDSASEVLSLPFVMLPSRSTGQPAFPLFIEHRPLQSRSAPGRFNTYGLSREATVPWFV